MVKRILFICRSNMFRSRIAEALFDKYNNDKNIKVESAGIFEGDSLDKNVMEELKKLGINLISNPSGMSRNLVTNSDLLIIVANDIPIKIFRDPSGKYMTKIIKWEIPDKTKNTFSETKKIVSILDKKVKNLIKQLGKEK